MNRPSPVLQRVRRSMRRRHRRGNSDATHSDTPTPNNSPSRLSSPRLLWRAHGLSVAHPRPLVSYRARTTRARVLLSQRPPDEGVALRFRSSTRTLGSSYGALALDCDDADAYARGFLGSEIPPPNWPCSARTPATHTRCGRWPRRCTSIRRRDVGLWPRKRESKLFV